MKFALTKMQQKYLPAIQWLLGGGSRQGRTTLLAFALIKRALCNPRQSIAIFDHNTNMESMGEMKRIINSIAKLMDIDGMISIKLNTNYIVYEPKSSTKEKIITIKINSCADCPHCMNNVKHNDNPSTSSPVNVIWFCGNSKNDDQWGDHMIIHSTSIIDPRCKL